MFKFVLPIHDVLVVRSSSVIRLAVERGMEVNNDTTSKETIVSSGSIFRFFMCCRNVTALDTEWVDVFISGCRMLARYFDGAKIFR